MSRNGAPVEKVANIADLETARQRYSSERAKRLRSDGNAQFQRVAGEFARYADDPYAPVLIERAPLEDEVEFLIIGGGFGSLMAGAKLKQAGFEQMRFVEKAGDFGGTWYWNRYPGAMCDIESYIYLPLLEELGYIPRHKYSYAPEILAHTQAIARNFNFYDDALFQTGVTEMCWDEDIRKWLVMTDRGDKIRARFVIMANGPLNRPKLPGIPGIESFTGKSFHTSRWDYAYTGGDVHGNLSGLSDKRVGVIGTGATGVQCIPPLGESAQKLYVFQRTPAAVDERNNRETDASWESSLETGWQRRRMENFNALVSGHDEGIDMVGDCWTDIFRSLTGTATRKESERIGRKLTSEERKQFLELADLQVMNRIRARVDAVVRNPATAEALKPWYKRWCKRPQFHDGYLETFNRPNVELVDTEGRGVDRIEGNKVWVGGKGYEVDCLIFATGFEVGTNYTERANYDIIGRGGRRLSQHWGAGFRTLHGLQANGFPNCFFIGTTQTGVAINYPHSVAEQVAHLAYIVGEMRVKGAEVVEVTEDGEKKWVDTIVAKARDGRDYYRDCTPGSFTNEGDLDDPRGLLAGAYGGGPIEFFELLSDWRAGGSMAGLRLEDEKGSEIRD